MAMLTKACCSVELATGNIFLGWMNALFGFMLLIILICRLPDLYVTSYEICLFYFIESIVQLYVSVLLLRGVMTKNRAFLVPWLIVTLINIIIVNVFLGHVLKLDVWRVVVIVIVVDLIIIYLWMWVYTHYRELEQEHVKFKLHFDYV